MRGDHLHQILTGQRQRGRQVTAYDTVATYRREEDIELQNDPGDMGEDFFIIEDDDL